MKILIGICGIGNGHLNRQTNVIELLLNNNNDLVIATTKDKIAYFEKRYKNISVIEVYIPWISCNSNGIDFIDTMEKYDNSKIDQFKEFLKFSINIEKCFDGIPDIVITDYEPNVARYSYAVDIPLICMEQQSKFLYLEELNIKNFSILEEKKRINYFFPKYNYKIISSFFPINIMDDRVKIVNPIISELNLLRNKKNHILVYFSPYGHSENYSTILNSLNEISDKNFIIYTNEKFNIKYNDNIMFKEFSDDFKDDLENSYCLICTSGHQLLSEAISIDIPMYLIPLNTYEQNYNALMIEKYNLGKIGINKDSLEILSFINDVQKYVSAIKIYKQQYYKNDWSSELLNIINKIYYGC